MFGIDQSWLLSLINSFFDGIHVIFKHQYDAKCPHFNSATRFC